MILTKQVVLSKLKQSTINFIMRGRQQQITDFNTRYLFYSKKTCIPVFIENKCSFCSEFTTIQLNLVSQLHFEMFTKIGAFLLNSGHAFRILSNSYCVYLHNRVSIRQLLLLCDSYQLYSTVISSMQQLLALYDSYQSYPTVISGIRQLSTLYDSSQLYATVMSPIRQLLS